jgi:hypothetical protein
LELIEIEADALVVASASVFSSYSGVDEFVAVHTFEDFSRDFPSTFVREFRLEAETDSRIADHLEAVRLS